MKPALARVVHTVMMIAFASVCGAAEQAPGPQAASTDPAMRLSQDLSEFLDAQAAKGFVGAVLVDHAGKTLYRAAFGTADCAGAAPLTPDHVFLIGSITKVYTRAALFKLEEEGRLHVDDALSRFIPSAPPDKADITLRQLMMHTAGFHDLIGPKGSIVSSYTVDYDYQSVTRDEMLARAMAAPLAKTPGGEPMYSNTGYSVLAAVIEIASGQSFEHYLRGAFFEPAGMARTGYVLPEWGTSRFAEGCLQDGGRWGSPLPDGRWMNDGPGWNLRGNGGMYSTLDDQRAWLTALGGGVLFDEPANAAHLAVSLIPSRVAGGDVAVFAGGNGITNAVYYWVRDDDIAIIIMSTRQGHPGENLRAKIRDLVLTYRDALRP